MQLSNNSIAWDLAQVEPAEATQFHEHLGERPDAFFGKSLADFYAGMNRKDRRKAGVYTRKRSW